MANSVFRHDPSREYFFQEGCHILEMLNDPADPDAPVVRARVSPGVTTAWHRLRGTSERYVILEGIGEVFVGDEAPQTVEPGDVVLIPPMVRQRIRNTGENDLIFLAICTPRFDRDCYIAS